MEGLSFRKMCDELHKGPVYIRRLQSDLGLHVARRGQRYSAAYLSFMKKVVALRTFNVPIADIVDLLNKERKILELLHIDSISDSPTWYLDACDGHGYSPDRLLLTGYDVGFALLRGDIQWNLDFRSRDPELFAGTEMGEDVRRVIDLYLDRVDAVQERITRETPVLERALNWSIGAFR